MDGELVSDLLSDDDKEGSNSQGSPLLAYTKIFYDEFPRYLSIGMTAEQYWDGDPTLVVYYRKADKIRQERMNQEAWIQGMYFYEALADVSPLMQAFAKKGTTAHPYSAEPYAFSKKKQEEKKEREEKRKMEAAMAKMKAHMVANNARFTKKEVIDDADKH